MKMQGGNIASGSKLKYGAGQVTGISEVQLCLTTSLIKSNIEQSETQEKALNMDEVAAVYKKWIDSEPFDKRDELSNSFGALTEQPYAHQAKRAANSKN